MSAPNNGPRLRVHVNFDELIGELKKRTFRRAAKLDEACGPDDYTHVRDLFVASWEDIVNQLWEHWRACKDGRKDIQMEVVDDLIYISEYAKLPGEEDD